MPKLDDAELPKILGFFTITPFESASQLVTESELPAPLFASTILALIRSSRATLVRPGSWMVMKKRIWKHVQYFSGARRDGEIKHG